MRFKNNIWIQKILAYLEQNSKLNNYILKYLLFLILIFVYSSLRLIITQLHQFNNQLFYFIFPNFKSKMIQEQTEQVLRLRGGGDHNVARERPEGCPYKSINVRRGNAMRFLVLDHIKEKPVRTKKALLYILSKDKRRAMENIAAQALFEKVDAYPPEERFYPLHVKPVDDLYYIPEKKVDQMVYVVNKLKKLSIESIVSDVTWETSTDDDGGDEDYIVDLKTDKLQDNAERCDKTLEEIEKYYFEADDGGRFSPRDPASPVSSGPPFRSIYESQTDTDAAALHPEVNLPAPLRRTQSIPLTHTERKFVKQNIKNRRNYMTLTANVSSDEDLRKNGEQSSIDRDVLWRQYAQSHLKNKVIVEMPKEIEVASNASTEEMDRGSKKRVKDIVKNIKRKHKLKYQEKLQIDSSDEEIMDTISKKKIKKAPQKYPTRKVMTNVDDQTLDEDNKRSKKVTFARSSFTQPSGGIFSMRKVPSKMDSNMIGDSLNIHPSTSNDEFSQSDIDYCQGDNSVKNKMVNVVSKLLQSPENDELPMRFKDRLKQKWKNIFKPLKILRKVMANEDVIAAEDIQLQKVSKNQHVC